MKKRFLIGLCMILAVMILTGCAQTNCLTGAAIAPVKENTCYDHGKVFYSLENKGTAIDGLKVRVEAEYDITAVIDQKIYQGAIWNGNLDFEKQGIKQFKSIIIIPKVGYETCYNAALEMELEPCS